MATLAELIQQAFREANYVAVGETPPAAEVAEALPRLQNLMTGIFGTDLGEHLQEWYAPVLRAPHAPLRSQLTPSGAAAATSVQWAYPPQNVRLVVKLTEDSTIYFPAVPSDGARMLLINVGSSAAQITIDGNGRLIEDAATVADTPANLNGRTWFYRADLGNWVRFTKPLSTEQSPFPEEFDDLWVCGLALRLAPRYGVKKIDDVIVARYTEMIGKLKTRYRQTQSMPATNQPGRAPASIRDGLT